MRELIMAIFGKNKADDISFESDDDYSTKSVTPATNNNFINAGVKSKSSDTVRYGIEDAIKLVRKLPNVNTEIVISVVIKTLESADIKVDEIVSDASQREARIEARSSTLITKIDELELQINKLNKEITQLNSDLEETSKVKDLLLRSIAQEASQQQKGKPAQQPHQQNQPNQPNQQHVAQGTHTSNEAKKGASGNEGLVTTR